MICKLKYTSPLIGEMTVKKHECACHQKEGHCGPCQEKFKKQHPGQPCAKPYFIEKEEEMEECEIPCEHGLLRKMFILLEKIYAKITNPVYGLKEIKCEVRTIEHAVLNCDYGLEEIKKEINELNCKVDRILEILECHKR